MSSIIDALKKSDNTRNAEDGSSVNQIKFSDDKPVKSRKGFWLLVIFLLFVAGGVYAWQQGWLHDMITNSKSQLNNDDQKTQNLPAEPKTANPIEEVQPKEKAVENNNKLVPPKTSDIKDRSAAAKMRLKNKIEEQTEKIEKIGKVELIKNEGKNIERDENASDVIVAVEKKEDQPNSDQKDSEADKKSELQLKQDYLFVHQIPFEIRKSIPPLKLNIHIYDPEPENRMIMLNGAKYAVGDVIDELVEIKDITKEGVVLKFETVEFLVPK